MDVVQAKGTALEMLVSRRKAAELVEDELDHDEEIPETDADSDQSVELMTKKNALDVQEDEELIKRLATRRATLHAELEDTLKELNKNDQMMKLMTDFKYGRPISPIPYVAPPAYEPCGQDFESDEIQDVPEHVPVPPSPRPPSPRPPSPLPSLPIQELFSDEDKTEDEDSVPDSPEYSDNDSDSDYTVRHFPDHMYRKFVKAGKMYFNDEVIAAAKTLRDFDLSPFDIFTQNKKWVIRSKNEFQLRQEQWAANALTEEARRDKKRRRVSSSVDASSAEY